MISPKINFTIEDFIYLKNGEPLRLVVFKIPATISQPTCYKQKSWIRKIYNSKTDWTAQIIEEATIEDLDMDAIQSAREGYRQRFPDFAEALQTWSDATFLDKAGLTFLGESHAECKDDRLSRFWHSQSVYASERALSSYA